MEDLINEVGLPLVVSVLVPLVVAAVKWWKPNIPKPWLPIIAALLGPVFDQAIAYVAGIEATGWQAALLGLAGIGLRELKDQIGKALSEDSVSTLRAILVAFMVGAAGVSLTACAGLVPSAEAIVPQTDREKLAAAEVAFANFLDELAFLEQSGQISQERIKALRPYAMAVRSSLDAAHARILSGQPAADLLSAAQQALRDLIAAKERGD